MQKNDLIGKIIKKNKIKVSKFNSLLQNTNFAPTVLRFKGQQINLLDFVRRLKISVQIILIKLTHVCLPTFQYKIVWLRIQDYYLDIGTFRIFLYGWRLIQFQHQSSEIQSKYYKFEFAIAQVHTIMTKTMINEK